MIQIHTGAHYVRLDRARGDREFFVAGVQPELLGAAGGGGVITLVYRGTGYVRRVKFEEADAYFKTALLLQGGR